MASQSDQPDEVAAKVAGLTEELRLAGERLAAVNDEEAEDKEQVSDAGSRAAGQIPLAEAEMSELIMQKIGEITDSPHYERVRLELRMSELTAEIEQLTKPSDGQDGIR